MGFINKSMHDEFKERIFLIALNGFRRIKEKLSDKILISDVGK